MAPLIRQHGPDALLVLSADAVCKLDYRQVVDARLDSGGEVTMVTAEVDPAEAGRYGVVQLDGYWRDVGTVEAYWQAHRDFLAGDPPLDLDDPAWPVCTRGGRHSAARIMPGAEVAGSLISGGTRVAGTVHASVISPGVVVEAGAAVTDSVLPA